MPLSSLSGILIFYTTNKTKWNFRKSKFENVRYRVHVFGNNTISVVVLWYIFLPMLIGTLIAHLILSVVSEQHAH